MGNMISSSRPKAESNADLEKRIRAKHAISPAQRAKNEAAMAKIRARSAVVLARKVAKQEKAEAKAQAAQLPRAAKGPGIGGRLQGAAKQVKAALVSLGQNLASLLGKARALVTKAPATQNAVAAPTVEPVAFDAYYKAE